MQIVVKSVKMEDIRYRIADCEVDIDGLGKGIDRILQSHPDYFGRDCDDIAIAIYFCLNHSPKWHYRRWWLFQVTSQEREEEVLYGQTLWARMNGYVELDI
jgi:hypothetical protein